MAKNKNKGKAPDQPAAKDAPTKAVREPKTEEETLDRLFNPTSVRGNIQAFVEWVEANGGPKINAKHAQIVVTGYKRFQRSDQAKESRAAVAAERLEAKEARAAARAEKAKEREAAKAERAEKRAEAAKAKQEKAAKATKTAAAASKPKGGKTAKATPTATAGKATAKKAASKKTASKAAF